VPALTFPIVDVRDVAEAHLRALALPREKTEGRRFILSHEEKLSLLDMSAVLRDEFAPMGYRPSAMPMPKWFARVGALFLPELHTLLPLWGRAGASFDAEPARSVLGIEFRDARDAVRLSAYSAVHFGVVPQTAAFKQKWVPPQ